MGRKKQSHFYILIALLLFGGLYVISLGKKDDSYTGEVRLTDFPRQIGNWQGEDEPIGDDVLNVLKADALFLRKYTNGEKEGIWFYVGYHRSQKVGAQIHSPRNCYPGSGWEIIKSEIIDLSLAQRELRVNKLLLEYEGQKRLVLYWYQSQGQGVANDFAQRLYMMKNVIVNGRSDGALVRVSAPVGDDIETTLDLEIRFLDLFFPKLLEYLPS